MRLNDYRDLFSVVSQVPYLFYDTVLNNIDLVGNASVPKMNWAMAQSGAHEFIGRLPRKGNSGIGRNGAKLSGGEKQKLAVARAIVKDDEDMKNAPHNVRCGL